jgi:hypothetical protein
MDRPPMPVHSQASRSTLPSMAAVPAAATCPRCRGDLAILRPESPRMRGITAHLCPSLSCGYKLIVPM